MQPRLKGEHSATIPFGKERELRLFIMPRIRAFEISYLGKKSYLNISYNL